MSDYSGILHNQGGHKPVWERAIKKIVEQEGWRKVQTFNVQSPRFRSGWISNEGKAKCGKGFLL